MVAQTFRADEQDEFGPRLWAQRASVQRLCRRLIRSPERAEELAQEALLVAYRKRDQIDGRPLRA